LLPDFVEPISKPLVLAKLPIGLLQTIEEIACARGVVDQKLDLAHAEIMQSRAKRTQRKGQMRTFYPTRSIAKSELKESA
jgi:hypothetical protein